jgi:hypothetical protein
VVGGDWGACTGAGRGPDEMAFAELQTIELNNTVKYNERQTEAAMSPECAVCLMG